MSLSISTTNTQTTKGLVVLIDDDTDILDAFNQLLTFEGYECMTFGSANEYLAHVTQIFTAHQGPTCMICDVKMPDIDGLELQRIISQNTRYIPLIMMSGLSGAEETVSAFRAGAFDFLLKPIDAELMLKTIERAMQSVAADISSNAERDEAKRKLAQLTDRELEVAKLVAKGMTNIGIGLELGISLRTVKFHRQRVLEKLQVAGATGLVRLIDKA
jgi:FixJ family two-component response regulator